MPPGSRMAGPHVGQKEMRHFLNIFGLLWISVGLLGCGRPTNDFLLKQHLGSLDPSKTTRIEIDFSRLDPSKNRTKDWTAWFYIEASESIISDVLRAENYSPGVFDESTILTRLPKSEKIPDFPDQQNCFFYTSSPQNEPVVYSAITNKAKDRLWIVARKY